MAGFHYHVNLVCEDLTPRDTYSQLLDSLVSLSAVCEDVFARVDAKVEANAAQLVNLDTRISAAQHTIDCIRGCTKALQVFSVSKYPCTIDEKVFSGYRSIYENASQPSSIAPIEIDFPLPMSNDKNQFQTTSEDAIKNKLKFYSVPPLARDKSHDHQEGLGTMPDDLENVGSLLLFNTSENLYKEYVYLDPLGVEIRTRTSAVAEPLAAAPVTIGNRDTTVDVGNRDNFLFVPDIGDVPSIELPDFLPDLLGVAGDLSYENENIWSIAPSVPGNLVTNSTSSDHCS